MHVVQGKVPKTKNKGGGGNSIGASGGALDGGPEKKQ